MIELRKKLEKIDCRYWKGKTTYLVYVHADKHDTSLLYLILR